MTRPLFHGGMPGLRVGDLLVPHAPRVTDGCPICAARAAGATALVGGVPIDPPTAHPDSVYVTADREYGRFYASLYGRGDLYRVEPVGDLTPTDDEDRFPCWRAPSARVAGVVARAVLLTPGERRRLTRRWAALDLAAEGARS